MILKWWGVQNFCGCIFVLAGSWRYKACLDRFCVIWKHDRVLMKKIINRGMLKEVTVCFKNLATSLEQKKERGEERKSKKHQTPSKISKDNDDDEDNLYSELYILNSVLWRNVLFWTLFISELLFPCRPYSQSPIHQPWAKCVGLLSTLSG